MSCYRRHAKRALDLVASACLLLVLLPALLVVALVVRISLGRPVLFRQQRPGLDGRPFTLLKFRTLLERHDADGEPLADAERLHAVGRWLRRWSVDELPELLNVLRGDMSLVGPRPLLMRYLKRYSPQQMRRHEVVPGITGWAQVHGRNAVDWERRFELDIWYVEHYGLRLDLEILWRTLGQALSGRGVAAPGHATMPEFQGGASSHERS